MWTEVAAHACARYADIETRSGIGFHTPRGVLVSYPDAADWVDRAEHWGSDAHLVDPDWVRSETGVAIESGLDIAFEGAPAGHVGMLFVAPAAQGQGLAGALLAAVETAARASCMTRLTTEASHAARPVFHRAGFRTLYPRTLWRAGQWLHNTAMAKDLAEDP